MLWEAEALLFGQHESLKTHFQTLMDEKYTLLLKLLQEQTLSLSELSHKYTQILQYDYFHSELGNKVREALLASRGD